MDSMIGYKSAKYIDFGWAAAKLDDIFNFLPARINAILVPLACLLIGKNSKGSLAVIIKDGNKHPSPNSGISEAAFAGALGVQLGGECTYEGAQHFKPHLGKALTPLHISHIYSSINISLICSAMMIALNSLVFLIFEVL
jgi:adenosylcobinamide-phosphate synthase